MYLLSDVFLLSPTSFDVSSLLGENLEKKLFLQLKESAHMLGYSNLLSWPRIEMNTIWEPIIKKVWLKHPNMSSGKKIIHTIIIVIRNDVGALSL